MLGGRYQLLDEVGRGGMAVVWRARDVVLGRTVAVKLLAARHAGDTQSRQRIRAEAVAAAALTHPHIAQVYDYGESAQAGSCVPYVVMELVRGRTLLQRMAAGPLPPRYAMRVTAEVAAALAAAHAEGLVHRDVKPANILLAPDGVKVVDFGIAAAISSSGTGQAAEEEVLGTPAYVAPERLTSDAVDPAADVYALGVLLYRLLSGRSPFVVDTTTQMLAAHVWVAPLPLPALPEVPDYVTALCNRCLSKDPAARPSAREAAALLARGAGLRMVEDEPVPAAGAPDVPATPQVSRRRWLAPVSVATLVIAIAVAWFLLLNERGRAPLAAAPPSGAASGSAAVRPAPPSVTPAPSGSPSRRAPAGPGVPAADAPGPVDGPRTQPAGPVGGSVPAPGTTPATSAAPPSPPDDPAPTTPPPTDTLEERSLTSAGGTVLAICRTATTAELLSWSATKPYKVAQVNAGPAQAPTAVFKRGGERLTMTVTCDAGIPSTSNQRS